MIHIYCFIRTISTLMPAPACPIVYHSIKITPLRTLHPVSVQSNLHLQLKWLEQKSYLLPHLQSQMSCLLPHHPQFSLLPLLQQMHNPPCLCLGAKRYQVRLFDYRWRQVWGGTFWEDVCGEGKGRGGVRVGSSWLLNIPVTCIVHLRDRSAYTFLHA